MTADIPTQYDPATTERTIYQRWLDAGAFAARPRKGEKPYVIMMPLPNVTGALHMGHAMDGVMQDLLTRWHRMQGDNTLWMPGLDHAGIATQAVVEKRLLELEGKTRHDVGRAALEERIFKWSDRFRKRIVEHRKACIETTLGLFLHCTRTRWVGGVFLRVMVRHAVDLNRIGQEHEPFVKMRAFSRAVGRGQVGLGVAIREV